MQGTILSQKKLQFVHCGEVFELSQRRFAVMGENIFRVATKLMKDQTLCRLLHYTDRTPLDKEKPNINGADLLHRNILVVPKPSDEILTKENFVVVLFDNFIPNGNNKDFKVATVRFDILCPFDEWLIEGSSLRPYLIMQRIDELFNEEKLAGIGNLHFEGAQELVVSPQLGGYNMEYSVDEFN